MTTRETLAGFAMAGLLSKTGIYYEERAMAKEVRRRADAVIEELAAREGPAVGGQREFYVVTHSGGYVVSAHVEKDMADGHAEIIGGKVIHVREVPCKRKERRYEQHD